MAAPIPLPSIRPSGDDQEWKRLVAEALRQMKARLEAIESQLGKR